MVEDLEEEGGVVGDGEGGEGQRGGVEYVGPAVENLAVGRDVGLLEDEHADDANGGVVGAGHLELDDGATPAAAGGAPSGGVLVGAQLWPGGDGDGAVEEAEGAGGLLLKAGVDAGEAGGGEVSRECSETRERTWGPRRPCSRERESKSRAGRWASCRKGVREGREGSKSSRWWGHSSPRVSMGTRWSESWRSRYALQADSHAAGSHA